MRSAAGRFAAQFLLPNGAIVLGAALLLRLRGVPAALAPATNLAALTVLGLGVLLAWRFHAPRVFLMLCLLGLADWGLMTLGATSATPGGNAAFYAICLLLPLNYAGLALVADRDITLEGLGWCGGIALVQAVAVAVLSRPEQASLLNWIDSAPVERSLVPLRVPQMALLAFVAAGLLLLGKASLSRKPQDIGWVWALVACLLALDARREPLTTAYFTLAGLVLAVAVIETSYLMAYHDELTTLPSRRAFQQATVKLEQPYAIAMVDIDRFKKFNDTFGHETGDQVLRMVASRLARVTGGGQAFRLGGEEFAILFRGRRAGDLQDDLELLRQKVEDATFTVRGPDRSQRERQERRHGHRRERTRAEKADVFVTISIGVAEYAPWRTTVAQVVHAADMALYRAKENGRNRIEMAPEGRGRTAASDAVAVKTL